MTPVEALQQALAAQHACVFGYGAAVARAATADQDLLRDALLAHTLLRDRWRAELVRLQADPVAAEAAYRLPALTGRAEVRALARDLDTGSLAACSALIAATGPGEGPGTDQRSRSRIRGQALAAMVVLTERAGALRTDLGTLPGTAAREARRVTTR